MSMSQAPTSSRLGRWQRVVLLITSLLLAIALFLIRSGFGSQDEFEQLAQKSLEPEVALANGKPTMIEFYAEWCEACKEMAPSMIDIEQKFGKKINIIFLNVDNARWLDLIDKYKVVGIPYIVFFDSGAVQKGRSIGLRTADQIERLSDALIKGESIPLFPERISDDFEGDMLQDSPD